MQHMCLIGGLAHWWRVLLAFVPGGAQCGCRSSMRLRTRQASIAESEASSVLSSMRQRDSRKQR